MEIKLDKAEQEERWAGGAAGRLHPKSGHLYKYFGEFAIFITDGSTYAFNKMRSFQKVVSKAYFNFPFLKSQRLTKGLCT